MSERLYGKQCNQAVWLLSYLHFCSTKLVIGQIDGCCWLQVTSKRANFKDKNNVVYED